jgi:hypothetical protein
VVEEIITGISNTIHRRIKQPSEENSIPKKAIVEEVDLRNLESALPTYDETDGNGNLGHPNEAEVEIINIGFPNTLPTRT